MVGREVRDETGMTLVQTSIAVILMIVLFLCTASVGLAYLSTSALEAEIAEAVTRSNLAEVAASGNPDEAFEEQILKNSAGLVPENLSVDNTVVTLLDPIVETADAREVAGSTASTITRVRDIVRIEADVTYRVPTLIWYAGFGETVLEQHVDSQQTAETRIEVS